MNSLANFEFKGSEIRSITQDGQPWFVAKDVCDVLGLTNSRQAVASLDDDEKNTVILSDGISRGNPNVTIISESGLYELIGKSNKPAAKEFRRWVRKEVLPAIRKTGEYSAKSKLPSYDEVLQAAIHYREESVRREELMSMAMPLNLHLYGKTDENGKVYSGLRRATLTRSISRMREAAAFHVQACQLEMMQLLEASK